MNTTPTATPATFESLGLVQNLLRALAAEGYEEPTPIQAQTIPALLVGRDVLGIAQTGTGKTAAFALPLLQLLSVDPGKAGPRGMRALILAPTRELAIQIGDSIRAYGKHMGLRHTVIFGGVGQNPQVAALSRGLDIVVATPGRLLDLANQGHVVFDRVRHLVLDEADRMLDMGFIRDIRKIAEKLPKRRQSLLFSATMPNDISSLAESLLAEPVRVSVTPKVVTVERIAQSVHYLDGAEKKHRIVELLGDPALARVIVFTRTKHGANRLAEHLESLHIGAEALHGNKSQNARQRALDRFKAGKARVLVATDIAARGIDVDGITHVINYELPNEPESYVHRIGRTARAGADGAAISFCDPSEQAYLRAIERISGVRLTVAAGAPGADAPPPTRNQGRGGRPQRSNGPARPASSAPPSGAHRRRRRNGRVAAAG